MSSAAYDEAKLKSGELVVMDAMELAALKKQVDILRTSLEEENGRATRLREEAATLKTIAFEQAQSAAQRVAEAEKARAAAEKAIAAGSTNDSLRAEAATTNMALAKHMAATADLRKSLEDTRAELAVKVRAPFPRDHHIPHFRLN